MIGSVMTFAAAIMRFHWVQYGHGQKELARQEDEKGDPTA